MPAGSAPEGIVRAAIQCGNEARHFGQQVEGLAGGEASLHLDHQRRLARTIGPRPAGVTAGSQWGTSWGHPASPGMAAALRHGGRHHAASAVQSAPPADDGHRNPATRQSAASGRPPVPRAMIGPVMDRMDRTQFFDRLATLDEERLKKVLWNLYWRGTAAARQRIESELDPAGPRPRRAEIEIVDPEQTLSEVREFVELARSGAYLGGDRRVAPRDRTRWRFIFQRHVRDAELSLRHDDVTDGARAMELLIDLALEMRDYDYFRSEDPIEAARIVVSDEVSLLWSRVLGQLGFDEFARSAAPQLVRWESRFGWTRTGFGQTRDKEASLAAVAARLLTLPDRWVTFADCYLDALDSAAQRTPISPPGRRSSDRSGQQRADELVE
jgi:hypothetical protein